MSNEKAPRGIRIPHETETITRRMWSKRSSVPVGRRKLLQWYELQHLAHETTREKTTTEQRIEKSRDVAAGRCDHAM